MSPSMMGRLFVLEEKSGWGVTNISALLNDCKAKTSDARD